jgi:hypothetical protein
VVRRHVDGDARRLLEHDLLHVVVLDRGQDRGLAGGVDVLVETPRIFASRSIDASSAIRNEPPR